MLIIQYFLLKSLDLKEDELKGREVQHLDIAYDELPEKYYKEKEVFILQPFL